MFRCFCGFEERGTFILYGAFRTRSVSSFVRVVEFDLRVKNINKKEGKSTSLKV